MSLSLLHIFGAIFCMALCKATPTPSPDVTNDACRNSSAIDVEVLEYCIHSEFIPENLEETFRITNETRCIICKHLCRKQETILNCFKTFTDSMKDLSNKSRVMVPFLGTLFEEALMSFCEHEAEMIPGYSRGKNEQCYRESRRACKFHVDPLNNMDDLAFCDKENSEYGDNNQKLTCQILMDYLLCTDRAADSCTEDVKNTHASMISIIRNSETCGKYVS